VGTSFVDYGGSSFRTRDAALETVLALLTEFPQQQPGPARLLDKISAREHAARNPAGYRGSLATLGELPLSRHAVAVLRG